MNAEETRLEHSLEFTEQERLDNIHERKVFELAFELACKKIPPKVAWKSWYEKLLTQARAELNPSTPKQET